DISGAAYPGLDIQAQLLGSAGFTKTGAAAMYLSSSNSFNGSIFLTQGILEVRNNKSLGDIGGDTELLGGTLLLRNVSIADERLLVQGQAIAGELPGSLLTCVGGCSWSGDVVLYTNLNIVGDINLTGSIAGTGGLGRLMSPTILRLV